MKTLTKFIILLMLLTPITVQAVNVCVWNSDPSDQFYDSLVNGFIDCSYWVENLLTQQGHNVEVVRSLPADLSRYNVVFCLMGWIRC